MVFTVGNVVSKPVDPCRKVRDQTSWLGQWSKRLRSLSQLIVDGSQSSLDFVQYSLPTIGAGLKFRKLLSALAQKQFFGLLCNSPGLFELVATSCHFVIVDLILAVLEISFLTDLLNALANISVLAIEVLALSLLRRLFDPPGENVTAFQQLSDTIAPWQMIVLRTELFESRPKLPVMLGWNPAR